MRRMIICLIAAAMLIKTASAFDCNKLEDKDDCDYILDSGLDEKIAINLMYRDNYIANHTLVRGWNTALEITEPPENVDVSTGIFIEGAWVKVLSVMPSVREGSRLYVPFHAYIMSGYGHEVILPSDYHSPGYPLTDEGDNNKNLRSKNNLQILGKWIKMKLQNAGALQPLTPVTYDTLKKYGRDYIRLYKLRNSLYYMDFR